MIVASLTEADSIQRIPNHIGESFTPPGIACLCVARRQAVHRTGWKRILIKRIPMNPEVEPVPEFQFDQTVSW